MGMGNEFVLQTHILAHEEFLIRREVIQEEIGLARLQHCAEVCSAPIEENFRRIDQWQSDAEPSERIHLGISILTFATDEDVVVAYFKFTLLPLLFRHIFQPSHESDGFTHAITIVLDAPTRIFLWIVRQCSRGNRATSNRFQTGYLDGTDTFLHLAHLDGNGYCSVAHHQSVSVFLFRLTDNLPKLVCIDDTFRSETDEPITRSLVAPIGVINPLRMAKIGKENKKDKAGKADGQTHDADR